jgi:hypothetical protein
MNERLMIVSACAALAFAQACAGTTGERSTTASGQASEPVASGQGSTAGQAEEAGARPEATEAAKQTVIGTVKKLEKDALTVQTSPLSDPHELELSDDTRFVREGRSISREQLGEGDMVRADFVGEGDSGRAIEITVIGTGRQEEQGEDVSTQHGTGAPEGRQEIPSGDQSGTR